MKFDVAVFGSAFVDVYLQSRDFKLIKSDKVKSGLALCQNYGGKLAVGKLIITTGGGATNNAVGFERLGLQTAAICCVGDDDWGLFVRKKLAAEGVSLLYVQVSKNRQTSYSTILVNSQGGRTILAYRGASNDLSWSKVAWGKLNARWFHVSSLGGNMAMLTKIIRTAEAKKIKISFNPGNSELNLGKKLWPFLSCLEVLILNQQEAEKLLLVTGNGAVEKNLGKLGAKMVLITRGKKGAILYDQHGKIIRQAVYKVDSVEETGAGDAFGTGFVSGLLLGHNNKTALKIAAANAASVVAKVGPKKGLLFGPEVVKWL